MQNENHVVEVKYIKNTDKFRPAALHFQKYGFYNSAPKGTTQYYEYWDEEARRCLYGYEVDGDFISGYFYFYLNYCPILLINPNAKRKERIREFARFYDYDKAYFDAVEEAELRGKHLVVIKKRGAGYSFKGASMLCRNFFLIPESNSFAIASEAEFLTKDGLLSKAWEMMAFLDEHTAWAKKRQKTDQKMHKVASYLIENDGVPTETGFQSSIMGVTLKNDVQKARGKRGKLILWEEAGKFPNLKTAWQIAQSSVEDNDGTAFGLMIAYGTGGTEDRDYEGLKDLFYEPNAYNCLPIENIWDEGAVGPCGFFIPQYYNMGPQFMDADGNSLLKEAMKFEIDKRRELMESATDKRSIDRYIAEKPFTPQEATLQLSGNIFPKEQLIKHLSFIRTHKKIRDQKQVGNLVIDENGLLVWEQSKNPKDLTKYRLDKKSNNDVAGEIVIWEHPIDNPPYGLYIAGCLTPGERVITNKGLMNVEDVTLEDKLVNKEGEYVSINTLLRYDKKDESIYKIHMSNVDRPTTYTQEHPLYLSESFDGEYSFIEAKHAKEGMWNKYPNFYNKVKEIPLELWEKHKKKIKNQDVNPLEIDDFWWFVGHWLGDGFNHKQGDNYTIYNSFGLTESEYVNKYRSIVSRVFNRNPHLKLQNGSNTHKFEHKQLFLFLEENFGKYAGGKFISEWVKFIPDNLKLQLILGYLDSDGSVFIDRTLTRASFKSINIKLLNDIQDILFSLGIISKFNLGELPRDYNIKGKEGKTQQSYSLQIGKVELKKLADKYIFDYYSRKLRKAKEITLLQKPRENNTCIISEDNNYIFIKIKKIESSVYTGVVYNFDCETHTFITQYCTGHNCDPYDHDKSGTDSLGSVFIYKRFQDFESYYDMIVAEYTGRPDTAEMYYENVLNLLRYYKATLLYENEKKGIFQHFVKQNAEYLLADQPDIINDILQKNTSVQRKKGVHMTIQIKDWGEIKIKEYLKEDRGDGKLGLHTILSEPLLEELIAYNDTGNFDRVMAFMMVIIYREELHKVHVKEKKEIDRSRVLFPNGVYLDNIYYD